jgi:hypothetical protein
MSRFFVMLSVVAPIFHLPKGTPHLQSLKGQVTRVRSHIRLIAQWCFLQIYIFEEKIGYTGTGFASLVRLF